MPPGPRLYVIPATGSAVAAVIRRGPTAWTHIGRWEIETGYEPGAWFRGTIPPQKCDLSPDGRWFLYSAVRYPGQWEGGPVYEAISRLPWLQGLVVWSAGTTYTRGAHFVSDAGRNDLGVPDLGDATPVIERFGIGLTPPDQFAVERRRGWVESAGTPLRADGGPWDERRSVEMRKARPGGGRPTSDQPTLCVTGLGAGFRSGRPDVDPPTYWLEADEDLLPLPDLQWADWHDDGRLLTATVDGHLQIRAWSPAGLEVEADIDLSSLEPDPKPAPGWAGTW